MTSTTQKPLDQQAAELAAAKLPKPPLVARLVHDGLGIIGAAAVFYGLDRLIVWLVHR